MWQDIGILYPMILDSEEVCNVGHKLRALQDILKETKTTWSQVHHKEAIEEVDNGQTKNKDP